MKLTNMNIELKSLKRNLRLMKEKLKKMALKVKQMKSSINMRETKRLTYMKKTFIRHQQVKKRKKRGISGDKHLRLKVNGMPNKISIM